MKRFATLGAAVLAVAFSVSIVRADNPKKSATVSATIVGLSDISTFGVYDMTNALVPSAVSMLNPDNAVSWGSKGNNYIKLAVTNNISWELKTYTDNFAFAGGVLPATTTWGYQYGGLKGPVSGGKGQMAGLGWLVLADTGVVQFGGPDPADPGATKLVGTSTVPVAASDWLFVKDRSDQNVPVSTGTDTNDESFAGAAGYTNVAFSEGSGSTMATRIVRPTFGIAASYSEPLATKGSPFYYFLGANFNALAPGAYTATVNFELINK